MKTKLTLLRQPERPAIEFDSFQQAVINHRGSPLVVLGGPGVGKSATLVAKVKSYVESGVDANKILVITFDRHRATELNDEIFATFRKTTAGSVVKTFPALAFAILRLYRSKKGLNPPRLLSGPEQEYFIRELIQGAHANNDYKWPSALLDASQTRIFTSEIRDFISRATQLGISPTDLQEMSSTNSFPLWQSVSNFFQNYKEVSNLNHENAYDSNEILAETIAILSRNKEFLEEIRSHHQVILIDEFQESDLLQRNLLQLLYSDELTLFVDPDSSVGRFRGADPETISEIQELFSSSMREPAKTLTLTRDYRANSKITDLSVDVASRFSYSRLTAQRNRISQIEADEAAAVSLNVCESVHEEARFIAEEFQRLHLGEGVAYGNMAVILRSPSTRAATLRRVFTSLQIPVREEIQSLPLISQTAVAPLITLGSITFGLSKNPQSASDLLTSQTMDDLLLSRYGGADFLTLKRIRSLILNSKEESDTRSTYDILREYLLNPTPALTSDETTWSPVKRISDLIAVGRKAAKSGATSEDVLWALWSNAKDANGEPLSTRWQRDAIAGDENADRDLDGVLTLFEAAARYADQRPGNTGDAFIRQLSNESIASDTIAAKAQRPDVVSILTTHTAKGREWEAVAVVGVEEGVWPNLTPRGSLLGTERLIESVREGTAVNRTSREFQLAAYAALKDDERRLFYNAITRTRKSLIITAVSGEESRPSQFFNEVAEFLGLEVESLSQGATPRSNTYMTPTHLIAALRQEAESPVAQKPAAALALLASLNRSGIPAANPNSWYGVGELSTNNSLFDESEQIRISPSSLNTLQKCPLKWALEYSGGRDNDSAAQIVGTTLHAVAARLKEGVDLATLKSELKDLWQKLENQLDIGTGWSARAELNRALEMVEKVVNYHERTGRTLLGVEEKFTITVGNVTLSGSIDRLEVTSDGELYVVDLKTSKTAISKADGQDHPQLKIYQLAAVEGAFSEIADIKKVAGAELFYPSDGKKGAERTQPPIDSIEVKELVTSAGETVSSDTFFAVRNDLCRTCSFKGSCPIRPEGRPLL